MLKKIMLPAFILFSAFCFSANNASMEDCMELLKDAYRKLSISDPPADDKTYFFEYEMKSVYKDKSVVSPDTRVRIYVDKDHSQVLSQQMEVYQDRKDCFTMIPSRNLIYRGDSQFGIKDTVSNISALQIKMLDQAQIKSCKDVTSEGKWHKEIIMEPVKDIKQKAGLEQIKFQMDPKNNLIREMIMSYNSNSKYQTVKLTYLNIDFDYKKTNINYSASSKFLNKEGNMLSKYKGYKLVDVRNKSK